MMLKDDFTKDQLMTLFRKFKNQRVAEVSDIIIECQQQQRKIAEDTRERNLLLQRREVHHKNAYVCYVSSSHVWLSSVYSRVRLMPKLLL